jgi:hypothetical protein
MTEEQMDIAAEFINELQSIGVFEPIPEGYDMKANCPLFAVTKPRQPGQWRIIADMKNGRQNAHVGKDPVHLPRFTKMGGGRNWREMDITRRWEQV